LTRRLVGGEGLGEDLAELVFLRGHCYLLFLIVSRLDDR
jgi:hypothetical protein